MAKTTPLCELSIYAEKITAEDYDRLFNRLIKKHIPMLEFLDVSRWFSFSGFTLVLKRFDNTIKVYISGSKGSDLYKQSALFFPFRINEPKEVELRESHFSIKTRFVSNLNMFDFMIKENAEEIRVKIVKLFGKFYGLGNFISKEGGRGILFLSNPKTFFEIDLEKNPLFYIELLDPIPKAVYLSSGEPLFEQDGISIGIDNFSVFQHTLMVGSSGTGKSKLIEIMIRSIKKKHEDVNVLVIDPHGEFSKTFSDDPGVKVIDYIANYIEPFDVGQSKSPLVTQLVAQLITSTIAQESKYAERVVFYSVHLLASIDQLTLENINLLLTDSAKRMEFSSTCQNDEVRRFFDEEFQNIYLHHFNDAILPVINFIGEYQLYLGKARNLERLEDLLRQHKVVVVSFNPHYFGRKIIRFFAGAIINQAYLMAISEKLQHPTILVVDEFPTVESKVTKDILAETRKFQLYMHVSSQYLGQISKVVLDAIMGNVRNVISFKVTRQDADILVAMMEIKVEEFFKKRVSPSELEESKKEMFLKLHPRECIVRLFDGAKYILPMKVKTVDLSRWRAPGKKEVHTADEGKGDDLAEWRTGTGHGAEKVYKGEDFKKEPAKKLTERPVVERAEEEAAPTLPVEEKVNAFAKATMLEDEQPRAPKTRPHKGKKDKTDK